MASLSYPSGPYYASNSRRHPSSIVSTSCIRMTNDNGENVSSRVDERERQVAFLRSRVCSQGVNKALNGDTRSLPLTLPSLTHGDRCLKSLSRALRDV